MGLRCIITVHAGVIVGEPMKEYTRTWNVTQEDLDNPPRFIDMGGAAMNYAMSLQNPQRVNWVKHEWIWL